MQATAENPAPPIPDVEFEVSQGEALVLREIKERLPSIPNASLPEVYRSATEALSRCADIDEVKEWADRALALASYARQAQDKTLVTLAMRIRARAIRRAGELMKVFQADTTANLKHYRGEVDHPPMSQRQAASAVGFSEHQEKQARRVAEIPVAEFERMVDSESPPTISTLADIGRKELSRPKPPGFAAATQAIGQLHEFAAFCRKSNPQTIAGGIEAHEAARVRADVSVIDGWLDQLIVHLTGES